MRDVSAGPGWHRWGAGWEVSGQWGVPRTSKSWRLMWSCRQRKDAGFSESWVSWSSGIYNGLTWQEQQQPYELWETLLGSEKEEDKPSVWASASPTHGAWAGWGLSLGVSNPETGMSGHSPYNTGLNYIQALNNTSSYHFGFFGWICFCPTGKILQNHSLKCKVLKVREACSGGPKRKM